MGGSACVDTVFYCFWLDFLAFSLEQNQISKDGYLYKNKVKSQEESGKYTLSQTISNRGPRNK